MDVLNQLRSLDIRTFVQQALTFGMIVASAIIIWHTMMIFTRSESPIVVVLSGSMEPGFYRGDLLMLYKWDSPIRRGEIVVYKLPGRDIPIVHRIMQVHRRPDTNEVYYLTKGDNNGGNDLPLYRDADPTLTWLTDKDIQGRAYAWVPYIGMITIVMNDYPLLKYVLIGALAIMVLTGNDE